MKPLPGKICVKLLWDKCFQSLVNVEVHYPPIDWARFYWKLHVARNEFIGQLSRTQWSLFASIFLAMSGKQIIDQWMFCAVQKLYLLILANLQSNKRRKKETLRFSHQHFAYTHLSRREIFHSLKKKSRKLFTFLSFLNQSSCITSYNIYRFICPIDHLEPELRDRWEKTLKLNLLEKRRNF